MLRLYKSERLTVALDEADHKHIITVNIPINIHWAYLSYRIMLQCPILGIGLRFSPNLQSRLLNKRPEL